MKKNKKNRTLLQTLRNYFFTGIVVSIPIAFTLYLTLFLIKVSSKIIPQEINPNNYLPLPIPGLEILVSIIFITLIGGLSLSFIGKKFLQIINKLFEKIPVLRTIYSSKRQMTETLTQKKGKKKTVVLIEYPRKGTWAVGFATKENTGEIKNKTNYELFSKQMPHYSILDVRAKRARFLWKIDKIEK